MYKLYQKTILVFSILLIITSCDLDKYPFNSLPVETAWESVEDAKNFRNGIYSYFRTINGGFYIYTSDIQSDLFNATLDFGNRGGDMHRWDFNSTQYDIEDIWQYTYYTINNCNNIIENIDRIEDDDPILGIIKGEAYLMRAICFHNIAIRFAKDYEPSTAASTLGIPITLVVDPNAKPARSSLEDTYLQIKDDITQARRFLTTEGSANSYYFTKDVIDLFEARVNLYMHNFGDAVNLADNIIAKYPVIETDSLLSDMWLNDAGSEVLFKTYMSISERTNAMTVYLRFSTTTGAYNPDWVPSQWVLDLYDNSDIRKTSYFFNGVITSNNETATDVYMLYKYPGNPDLKDSQYQYYNQNKVFRSPEAYLIAAEASYRNNSEGAALNYLNQLREKRSASSFASLSGDALFTEIKNEWIREFIGEGKRLDDLKRWGDGFTRRNPQNPNILMSGNDYQSLNVTSSNIKFVWEIPSHDLNSNSNLISNWGE